MDLTKELPLRFILLLLLLLSFPAFSQTQLYFEESQALTRAVPTTSPVALPVSATKPLLLSTYTRYRVTVCPPSGYSFTGTGKIRFYVFVPYVDITGKWAYNPEVDQRITITGVVDLCQIFGFPVDVRKGYLLPATVAVGVTGGSVITVRIDPDNF